MADMPWAPAARVNTTANRWLDDGSSGGGPGDGDTVVVWDGQAVVLANVYWWDGQAIHLPGLVAYWDGVQIGAVQ